jgi:1-acyl-sn-glycerol-3-phosphate acyltransferase
MRTIDFIIRYTLSLAWLLLMSIVGVLLIPVMFGNLDFNRAVARFGAWGLRRITRIRIEVEGAPELDKFQPCIYIGNHQDNFDVYIFGSIFPRRTIVVGKRELIWVPFFNLFFYAAGNIFIDRKRHSRALDGIRDAGWKIREKGVSVMILPEGTRNKSGVGLLPFKKGAFHLAIEAGLPLVPIVASPVREVLDYRQRRITPGVIRLRVLEPIPTKGLRAADVPRLLEEGRAKMLAAWEELARSSSALKLP